MPQERDSTCHPPIRPVPAVGKSNSPCQFACAAAFLLTLRALIGPTLGATRAQRVHLPGASRTRHRGNMRAHETSMGLVDAVMCLLERALTGGLIHIAHVVDLAGKSCIRWK